jgi:thiol-disulfide isomerase/thioredoxin
MKYVIGVVLLCLSQLCVADAIKPFVSGSMAQIMATQQQRPMIVSFWSIDCPPCYKELRLWRELSSRYPQLNLVLVSTDDAENRTEVQQVLQELGVDHLHSWRFADGNVQRLRYEIDRRWYGELPRTYFYAPGSEPLALSGVIDSLKVEQWLAQFPTATK